MLLIYYVKIKLFYFRSSKTKNNFTFLFFAIIDSADIAIIKMDYFRKLFLTLKTYSLLRFANLVVATNDMCHILDVKLTSS